MDQGNDSLRDRLLARLPQPENLAAYREETESLLAKHEKALFWEKMPSTVLYWCAAILFMISTFQFAAMLRLDAIEIHAFQFGAGLLFFVSVINDLRYSINRSKVDMLKEVKQVQLQVLELQASLQKTSGDR